jgi:DNA-binding LacI/PurR family transcriptional regulator
VGVAGRPDDGCPFPWIETEHGPGMAAAARHLASLGHASIGFLGGQAGLRFVQERERHWREALSSPGPVAYLDADALLDASPTAVACTSDALALALISAARARGLRVPGDLSVTGFDDSPLAQLSSPALTSVRVDYTDYGAAAAAALLAAIDGAGAAPYSGPPPDLIVRGSTAPAG